MCVCINYYAQWSFVHNSILYMYELLYLNKKKNSVHRTGMRLVNIKGKTLVQFLKLGTLLEVVKLRYKTGP